MKIFISWSGELSRRVATELRDWLGSVVQNCDPWLSERDIEAGSVWFGGISEQIRDTKFGITCVSRENRREPWLLWEAGAMYRGLESEQRIVPLLIDLTKSDAEPPLSLFQAKEIGKQGDMLAMLQVINGRLDRPVHEDKLTKQFEKYWPDLRDSITSIQDELSAHSPTSPRSQLELISEVLEHVRAIRSEASEAKSRAHREALADALLGESNLARKRGGLMEQAAAAALLENISKHPLDVKVRNAFAHLAIPQSGRDDSEPK